MHPSCTVLPSNPTTRVFLWGKQLSTSLENLFAAMFIARPDVKGEQESTGRWHVHTTNGKHDAPRIPWRREDITAHIEGRSTFGHYLLSKESKCKLFAFDVDLAKAGRYPTVPLSPKDVDAWDGSFLEVPDLRAAWLDRKHPSRDYLKLQFKDIAHKLLRAIVEGLELPCAAAYSGGKGIHVYGFTGLIDAAEAREGAQIVLDAVGGMKATRGENFFAHEDYSNLSIEVFPKQGSLDGKDLGNLMRLPLGKNLKAPKEPTFFIDMTSPHGVLRPMDSVTALTKKNPWE